MEGWDILIFCMTDSWGFSLSSSTMMVSTFSSLPLLGIANSISYPIVLENYFKHSPVDWRQTWGLSPSVLILLNREVLLWTIMTYPTTSTLHSSFNSILLSNSDSPFYWVLMAPGTSPTFTESSRLFLYFLGSSFWLCNALENIVTLPHRWCVLGIPSQWCRQGEKKGVGHCLPIASSMCFILSDNNKLACVSHLPVGKIFLGYVIASSPVS